MQIACKMAEESGEPPAEGEEPPVEAFSGLPPNAFHVTIESARGLPEESATVVEFKYSMLTEEQAAAAVAAAAEKGDDEKPLGIIEGKTTEFEEPPAGTEHMYGLKASYVLPPITGLVSPAPLASAACLLLPLLPLVLLMQSLFGEAVRWLSHRSAAVSIHHGAHAVQRAGACSCGQGAGGIAGFGLAT